jgi:group II intron reverse transcriptase/maturase
LSKTALRAAWDKSRDATTRAGRPGIDDITASQFSAKLDARLDDIVRCLLEGRYGFSKLRAVFVPKEDSDKERVICIPTVRDRLVQRAIAEHLTSAEAFPINNASSFGFIRGLGPQSAIKRVVELRSKYDWCLKTDIQSFFDKIQRPYIKRKVAQALKGSSLESLVFNAIDCEVRPTPENRSKLQRQGITAGLGIRQGMPLSPLLANLALADFDKDIERRKVKMVRYADDLALFFRTKEEAQEGRQYIKLLLQTVQLSIPEIADGSKTKIVSRSDPLEFLGREIVYLGSSNSFVARVGARQIDKIKTRLRDDFSFQKRSAKGKNLQDTIVDLSKSLAAYLGIYKDASNFNQFEGDLKAAARSIVVAIFQDLFGQESLRSLSVEGRKFLGITILDNLEPNAELDV